MTLDLGGGQVVSVLAFNSNDPSSNLTEVYNFSAKIVVKKNEYKQKGPGLALFMTLGVFVRQHIGKPKIC